MIKLNGELHTAMEIDYYKTRVFYGEYEIDIWNGDKTYSIYGELRNRFDSGLSQGRSYL